MIWIKIGLLGFVSTKKARKKQEEEKRLLAKVGRMAVFF
jgi:hypothetical protein